MFVVPSKYSPEKCVVLRSDAQFIIIQQSNNIQQAARKRVKWWVFESIMIEYNSQCFE